MGTPQNDNSWTGWAISSFTNKLAAASGEMEPGSNGSDATAKSATEPRSSSVPPSVDAHYLTSHIRAGEAARALGPPPLVASSTFLSGPSQLERMPRLSNLSVTTPAADDAEDFGDDWGAMEDDDDVAEAWATPATKPSTPEPTQFISTSTTTSTAAAATSNLKTFDDQGEPDFAGWLSAQTKSKSKGALPKGLVKAKSPLIPARAGAAGRPAAVTRVSTQPVVPKVMAVVPAVKTAEEDEDWGDAWG